jgi:hypothetical protein
MSWEPNKNSLKRSETVSGDVINQPTKGLRQAYVGLAKERVLDILRYDKDEQIYTRSEL